eukprot:TRINITY_DN65002_c0_g1_i1.p1 TRINITY_DN65002_c0_g1~~TRINITY_DN65002_c0_g1_i1.p1  ORF type:complete len:462 (-),score=91.78 TRINITY_DN65002_c0_g1_i1:62-1447(-)
MATPKPGGGEVLVNLYTKLPSQYQVPEEDLVVPSNLARYGLSEVVNRLLGLEKPVPFDFLVDSGTEFLRSTLQQHIEARRLSTEKVLRLEFVLALSEPQQSTIDETPDWISSIIPLRAFPSSWFAAVSYDGIIRIYEGAETRLTSKLADAGLAGLAALPMTGSKECNIAAAAQDGTLRCCSVHFSEGKAATGPVSSLAAGGLTRKALETVAFSEDGTLMASGGWDNEVNVWNANTELFAPPSSAGAGSKRKVTDAGEGASPKFSLQGHTQQVTCLQFGSKARFPFTILSGSWDCSVRVWDVAAASCVCNWSVARAVTSFSQNPVMPPQLATTHEDGHVSIWDIRAPPHATISGALQLDSSAGLPLVSAQGTHRRLASQVVWCPEDSNRIASVGHDGKLCILDPRSPKMPLQSLQVGKAGPMPTKLLCAAWLAKDELAVGGSDGKVVKVSLSKTKLPAELEN